LALEIERKYLVHKERFQPAGLVRKEIVQGFLSRSRDIVCRVRLVDRKGFLTVKARVDGSATTRQEFEYPVPENDAREMLALCEVGVSKIRYLYPVGNFTWEIDVFGGDLAGLILAEIELEHESDPYELPDFIDRDVTGDPAYLNSNLARPGFLQGA